MAASVSSLGHFLSFRLDLVSLTRVPVRVPQVSGRVLLLLEGVALSLSVSPHPGACWDLSPEAAQDAVRGGKAGVVLGGPRGHGGQPPGGRTCFSDGVSLFSKEGCEM